MSATDRNKILPIGEKGELVVSGYLVQKGYWNDPVRTAEVMMQDEKGNVWMHASLPVLFYCWLTASRQLI